MASEIRKDRLFGNFKTGRGYDRYRHKNSENYKRRPGMSPSHLERVRQLTCCVCLARPPVTVHHCKATGERGMGLRSTDQHAVPLCWPCHDDVERAGAKNETTWFTSRGVDALALALALWGATSRGVDAMQRIVDAHSNG